MCGIVGLVNGHPVASDLVNALERLEYRGYDSAGIAVAGPEMCGLTVHKVIGGARQLSAALDGNASSAQGLTVGARARRFAETGWRIAREG